MILPGLRGLSSRRLLRNLLVVSVLLVGLFFRTHDLAGVPPGLDGDEMFNGWDALLAWSRPFTVFVPTNFGSETGMIYLIALSTKVLGVSAWTVRLPSALCGVISLALTWALARRFFNFRVATLATALTAISVWPVLLNRVAKRAGLQPLCQAAATYALWRALKDRSNRWAIAAGVLLGLTQYTYTPSRFFPLVIVCWLLVLLAAERRLLRGSTGRLILIGLVALLIVIPLALVAIRSPDVFFHRVNELDSKLNRIMSGDLAPLWPSVRAALGMFTQVGDVKWRYNPSGRPVFDAVTGVLFYLGVLVCLWRARRPGHSLLLIWIPVMLLPTILGPHTPSFWHSVGALTPIYVVPAVGADFLWERITRWSRRRGHGGLVARLGLPAVALAGLVAGGADTWHDYFVEWPRHPEVLHIHEADLAAAARYLNSYTPADTPIWVSSEYPADLSRVLLELQTKYAGPVRWFNGNKVTVWPSGWAGRDVLIVYTRTAPPNPDALESLTDFLIHEESDAAGRPHLWVYRIPGEELSDPPWQPQHAVSGRFAYNREILGCDRPARVERGTRIPIVVYWRVPPDVRYDVEDLPHSYVCLQDAVAGRCMEHASYDHTDYPLWDWTEGDVVAERYRVPVPSYVLPQTTHFQVGMFTSVGEISFADEHAAGALLLIGPVEVEGTASVDPRWEADTPVFNRDLALTAFFFAGERSPGSTLEVELRWQAMRAPEGDYLLRLELRDRAGGDLVASTEDLLGSDRHPTSHWVSGEPVHTFHKIQIPPELEGGNHELHLMIMDDAGDQAVGSPFLLGAVSVSGRVHTFDLPEPEHPVEADFGSRIRLLGHDLIETAPTPGGQIEVVLYWQAITTMSTDYKAFVHVYHPTGDWISGQHDGQPGEGAYPTSSWLPDEVLTDRHVVSIEPGAGVGTSKIGVGLYDPSTGERLPVVVDGRVQPSDVLIIDEVEVR